MSILVTLLIAAGIFLMWMVSVTTVTSRWGAYFTAAAIGSLCLGVAGGLFYSLLDYPLVWP